MTKREPPNKEAFDKLLRWLGPDLDKAAKKYQAIHLRIVRIFAAKGCGDPEDLADQSFNVATLKIDWLLESYVGDPSLYIHGIAKKIFLELKPRPIPEPPPAPDPIELERRSTCLDQCLDRLTTPAEKRLVLRYHENNKQVRIRTRRQLAEELGLSMNALRIKVCYIHARLRPCIRECLQLLDA
jgi:DNA-directed RNA polymerase specialized sigma24 family protein